MLKTVLRVFLTLIIALVLGVIGLLIAMYIGGNYAEDFVFNGVRGYEATGQIGFIIGGIIGLVTGWWFLLRRKK
ncbi:MAG: LPXTG cell wall anchor domain-containing protein [Chloroflexi bacterium]|nr:LPXTG cell wall anchor domain-containing protein [Chloroflexota bacterium]